MEGNGRTRRGRTLVVSRVVALRALRRGDDGPDEQQHGQHRQRGERVHAPLPERHGLEGCPRGPRLIGGAGRRVRRRRGAFHFDGLHVAR